MKNLYIIFFSFIILQSCHKENNPISPPDKNEIEIYDHAAIEKGEILYNDSSSTYYFLCVLGSGYNHFIGSIIENDNPEKFLPGSEIYDDGSYAIDFGYKPENSNGKLIMNLYGIDSLINSHKDTTLLAGCKIYF